MSNIEEIKVGENTVSIFHEQYPESPREWDNLGTITYNPRSRHVFGDKGMEGEEVDAIINNEHDYIALPVYAYVHSGVVLNTTGFSCPWDSGQSGIIYVSREKIRKEWGVKRISPKLKALVEKNLVGEIETFSKYLAGEVYGFTVADKEGDIIESCGGFYDLEDCKGEAKECA
jgi:hypothetical protein